MLVDQFDPGIGEKEVIVDQRMLEGSSDYPAE